MLLKWHVGYKKQHLSTPEDMTKEESLVARGSVPTIPFDKLPLYAQKDMLSHLSKEKQIELLNKSKGKTAGNRLTTRSSLKLVPISRLSPLSKERLRHLKRLSQK